LNDIILTRIVAVALGIAFIVCLGGTIYLETIDKPPSVMLASTITGCLGALVGILAPTRSSNGAPKS
jgi:hypothetical protein